MILPSISLDEAVLRSFLPSREDIVLSITSSLVFTPVNDWREFLPESAGTDSRTVDVWVGMIVL